MPSKNDRIEVRFDPETLSMWPADAKRRQESNKIGTVIHYVENPAARTPNGGKFTSRRFTAYIDGRRWFGQMKKGTDIVRLRPASE